MQIREFRPTDLAAAVALFTASVRGLANAAYAEHQLRAWAPEPPDLEHWRRKLAGQNVLLADDRKDSEQGDLEQGDLDHGDLDQGDLIGMLGYEDDGHVDVLFTHPDHARRGIAARLHDEAERRLAAIGVHELFTEASEIARPFFERQGYAVEQREVVQARGVDLHRYRMRRVPKGPSHRG